MNILKKAHCGNLSNSKKKVSLKDEIAEREVKKEAARLALEKMLKAQRAKTSKAKS